MLNIKAKAPRIRLGLDKTSKASSLLLDLGRLSIGSLPKAIEDAHGLSYEELQQLAYDVFAVSLEDVQVER